MSENPRDSKTRVIVYVAGDAERRPAEERLLRVGAVDWSVATQLPEDPSQVAVLQLGACEPGASATGVVDYALPLDCSDDALLAAIALSAKIAALRKQLHDAHRKKDDFAALAATDPLTGLANRRAWDAAVEQAVRDVAERGAALCVAIVDLDEFKKVNDAQGHAIGDAVLCAAADGLRRAVRRGDLAARLGGDEFGLLLPDLPPEAAAAVVERIRNSANLAIVAAGFSATTCSAGFAATYADADAALRRAKQAGRNQTCGF